MHIIKKQAGIRLAYLVYDPTVLLPAGYTKHYHHCWVVIQNGFNFNKARKQCFTLWALEKGSSPSAQPESISGPSPLRFLLDPV